MTQQLRNLHLVGATGTIRTATYNEREHLVVPVVAMVEGVVWASNSDVPEFVSAEELAETPHQWNGRGCFAGHPKEGRTPVTGNTPRTLEKSFGTIFDTVTSDRILRTRRLEFDVWVDPAKADLVGATATRIVERLRANEMIEVSIGALIESEDKDGTFNGQAYHGVWHNIVSDHVAFLSEEETGACSVEAGCGAPRYALRHCVTRADDIVSLRVIPRGGTMDKNAVLKERCAAAVKAAEGMSDHAVRRAIDAALRATEPGYMGIDCVYPDDGYVIYYVAPEDQWVMKRCDYSIAKDGAASLTGKAVEVEPVTTYEPVTAQAKKPAAVKPHVCAANCRCKGDAMTRAERIASLVTNKHSGFKDGDEPFLETASDARLEEFSTAADASKTTAGRIVQLETDNRNVAARLKVAEEKLKAGEAPMTEAEFLAKAPAAFKAVLEDAQAREDAERAAFVTVLKDCGAHTEDELKKMTIPELEKLATYAGAHVPDFSGKTMPAQRNAASEKQRQSFAPPDPYAEGLKALRTQTKAVN